MLSYAKYYIVYLDYRENGYVVFKQPKKRAATDGESENACGVSG